MLIVIDSNVIRKSFTLKSNDFTNLFDFIKKTNSKIIITQIVYEEIMSLYKKELQKSYEEYGKFFSQLNALLVEKHIPINIEIDNQIHEYQQYLFNTLGFSKDEIVPYKADYLFEVTRRAINRIKPCSVKGEEFRDTILWLTVLDIVKSNKDQKVVFISHNIKEFAPEGKEIDELHKTLILDLESFGGKLDYFNSLGNFIKNHSSKLDFITDIWLKSEFDIDMINIDVLNNIVETDYWYLLKYAEDRYELTEVNINITSIDLKILDYYVYEKNDGTLYLELILVGNCEIECEVPPGRKSTNKYKHEYVLNEKTGNFDIEQVLKEDRDDDYKYEYFYKNYKVIISAEIFKEKIVKWFVKDYKWND